MARAVQARPTRKREHRGAHVVRNRDLVEQRKLNRTKNFEWKIGELANRKKPVVIEPKVKKLGLRAKRKLRLLKRLEKIGAPKPSWAS